MKLRKKKNIYATKIKKYDKLEDCYDKLTIINNSNKRGKFGKNSFLKD